MSFSVETTLSGKNYLEMMLDARARGFEVVLVYIGTDRGPVPTLNFSEHSRF
jgi:predicted ABC-type ATPase